MALNGTWRNELGSAANLTDDGAGGLTGTYVTAAGEYPGVPFPLVGRYDTQPAGTGVRAIGWTVLWQAGPDNAHSATTWSGQFHEANGQITTSWLLTSETTPADAWADTLVGQDLFVPSDAPTPPRPLPAASHPRGSATG